MLKKLLKILLLTLLVNTANAEPVPPALSQLQQALELHPDDSKLLNDTGIALYQSGKYAEAKQMFQKALEIDRKNLGQEHPNVATDLNNLAEVHQVLGDYAQAEILIQQALTIREKALDKNHSDIAQSLNNLAMLYQAQGKFTHAEPLLQKALAIDEQSFGTDHPNIASDLNNLGGLYASQKKYAQAAPYYLRSLTIDEKVLGKEHPVVASDLNNLAALYVGQKNYAQAEPLYLRSLAIREKTLAKNHPHLAVSLNNLGELYRNQSKFKEAEHFYQRSLAIKENALGQHHPGVAVSLDNLAMLYMQENKVAQAEPLFARSLQIVNRALSGWLWDAGEKTRQSYLQQQESRRNYYLSFYSLYNRAEAAFDFSLARKGVLLQIASEVSSLAKQSNHPKVQQQIQDFNRLKTELAAQVLSGKAKPEEIAALEERMNQLEMQLSQQVSQFKRSKTQVTAAQVLQKLTAQQALVDFLVYTEVDLKNQDKKTEQVIALVATPQNGIKLIKLGDLSSISELLTTYRQKVLPKANGQFPGRAEFLNPASQRLYELIWQPLLPHLTKKSEVFVIPDGILHLLPFKALQDKEGGYLAEKLQLTLLSSARDIVLPPLSEKTTQALIFAAPDYGQQEEKNHAATRSVATRSQDIYFAPLEGAAAEGLALNELMKPKLAVQIFQDKQASETKVAAIKSPRFLHFATHGFFLENQSPVTEATRSGDIQEANANLLSQAENPLLRSGLAFTGANSGIKGQKQADGTDGILTALEVLGLNLEGTDLVTLSACETGVGDIQVGEGVYSLNRAFQEAGAKSVLSTLWSVADEQTKQFMQDFYTLVLNGETPQQALQKTQLKFINDKNLQDPFFWAAFTVVGK